MSDGKAIMTDSISVINDGRTVARNFGVMLYVQGNPDQNHRTHDVSSWTERPSSLDDHAIRAHRSSSLVFALFQRVIEGLSSHHGLG